MANNFEIIFNRDVPMSLSNGDKRLWTYDDIKSVLDTHNCKYIIAPHIPDDMSSFNHYHVGIHTDNNNTYENIAKWFGLPANSVEKIRKRFESTYALYLIHYNQEGKTPVNPDDVYSNFNINYRALIENIKNSSRLDDILKMIDNGTIKEYNYTSYISLHEYTKWKRQIDNGFQYRKDRLKGIERKMDCIFITGDSGTGKTTYAKQICSDRGLVPYISSGSNDVLDDYKGEECIILDDLRPSCLSLSDLLKMLDNNTASTVKSRFRNKVLECKLIIITSTLKIDDFFSQVFENENETKIQLMRRCKLNIEMSLESITLSMYDEKNRRYKVLSKMPNVILAQFNDFKELTEVEKIDLASNILGCSSEMLKNLKDGIVDGSFIPDDTLEF